MSPAKDLPFLRYPDFSLLLLARFLSSVAMLTQSVTLGWQVYSIARLDHSIEYSSFLVGMIGLVQFLPMFAFVLLAGETADRYDRRKILIACCALQVVCSASLAFLAGMEQPSLVGIFAVAALFGVGRAFTMPASASHGADAGAARNPAARHRLEHARHAGRHGARPVARWCAVRHLGACRLRHLGGAVRGRRHRRLVHCRQHPAGPQGRGASAS